MKTSETTIYIRHPRCIYGYKLTNSWSQSYLDIYAGEIIRVKRDIITLENHTLNETERNNNTY